MLCRRKYVASLHKYDIFEQHKLKICARSQVFTPGNQLFTKKNNVQCTLFFLRKELVSVHAAEQFICAGKLCIYTGRAPEKRVDGPVSTLKRHVLSRETGAYAGNRYLTRHLRGKTMYLHGKSGCTQLAYGDL